MMGIQSCLLYGPQDAVQGVSTFLPTLPALDELGRRGNSTGQRRSGEVGSVITKTILFTNAKRFRLQCRKMRLDPGERDLAEKQPPQVPVFSLEEGSGTGVANTAPEAEGQVLGVDDRMSLPRAARNPNNSGQLCTANGLAPINNSRTKRVEAVGLTTYDTPRGTS